MFDIIARNNQHIIRFEHHISSGRGTIKSNKMTSILRRLTMPFTTINDMEITFRQLTGQTTPECCQWQSVFGEAFAHDDTGPKYESFQFSAVCALLTNGVQHTDTL